MIETPQKPSSEFAITSLEDLRQSVAPLREQLVDHAVYEQIETLAHLRMFLEHHVYAVWDFMSLLKWLQIHLTCVQVPWVPSADPQTRRLINEIVLEEESDEVDGESLSHFEMYLQAMEQCGADTTPVETFLQRIQVGVSVTEAMATEGIPSASRAFVETTWSLLETNKPHVVAAAFGLGREDVIPAMFRSIVADLDAKFPGQVTSFRTYLERHIHLDEEKHNPLALRMLANLCGTDTQKWQEARKAVACSLQSRLQLWETIEVACRSSIDG